MSALTALAPVTRSELIKFRSLRAQWGLLAAAAVSVAVLGPVQSVGQAIGGPEVEALSNADAAVSLALSGAPPAAMLMGVLGALLVASEYPRGSIAITFTAVPRRGLVVAAKALALTATALAVLVPAAAVAVEAARRILAGSGQDVAWTEPGVVRVVVLTGWYLVGWAVLGMVFGWLTRTALGASFAVLGVMLILPALVGLFGDVGRQVAAYLPSEAGLAMLRLVPAGDGADAPLGPWAGTALWTAYLLAGLALGRLRVTHHDA